MRMVRGWAGCGRTVRGALLLALAGAPLLSVPAAAQMSSREGIALQNEILGLQRDIQVLEQQIQQMGAGGYAPAPVAPPTAGPPPNADLSTQLLDRVSRLEDQVRQLRGQVDELDNRVQTATADLGKQIGDLGFRVQTLEGQGARAAPSAAPAAPAAPATQAAARPTPEMLLQDGHAALARRDYPAAAAAAHEVLAGYGRTPRAYDAQFLLAQALAGQHNWTAAAVAYDDAFNRNKKGAHAEDSLLGLANSLIALNSKGAACGALEQLRTGFPNPRADLRPQIASARTRAGCH